MKVPRVIVVGLGAMGSAAARELARRGADVLGLEAFGPGHDRGSSHGQSRIIRQAYYEDPCYVPLVLRAYQLWSELEGEAAEQILVRTGGLMVGPPDGEIVAGSLASAQAWDLPHRILSAAEVTREFPQFTPTASDGALYEPEAGFLASELAVTVSLQLAADAGARLHFGEAVRGWQVKEGRVSVQTAASTYEGDRLVLTAGAWMPAVLQGLSIPLEVERQTPVWFAPADIDAYQPSRFPVFMIERPGERMYYGVPSRDGATVKAARHHGGERGTVETVRREVGEDELREVQLALGEMLPGLGAAPIRRTQVCLYTDTPDYHFVIGRHPKEEAVAIAAGFSGHGFKFAPVVGEILADLVLTGGTEHNIAPFDPTRFSRASPAVETAARPASLEQV